MPPPPTPSQRPRVHRAARLEDAYHAMRARRAVRRGFLPTVIAYTGYGTPEWVRVLGRVVYAREPRPGSRAERKFRKREERIRGWRSFTSVPVTHARVTVEIGHAQHALRADRGGVIDAVIPATLEPGWHTITILADDSAGQWQAPVFIVDPAARFGVISDIDDTVMVTALPRPLLAAWNTFVLDEHARVPTPGMSVLLEHLVHHHPGAPVVYVSTGAWNVAPTITRFLSRNLFPVGPLLLTDWGPTHDRFFRNGRAHKEDSLRRLAAEFPKLQWLLLGDDGQHDEEIYGRFAAEYPENVAAVAIRTLSTGEAVLAGGRSSARPEDAATTIPWVQAPDGAGLRDELVRIGLLD